MALIEHVQVGQSQINLSASVRGLGLVTEANLDMRAHISSVVKSRYCHLRLLGKLWALSDSRGSKCHCGISHVQADHCNSTVWGCSS